MEREREVDLVDQTAPDIRVTPVRETTPDVQVFPVQEHTVNMPPAPRDSVRWGPIWAGLITALTTFVVLELLLYSLGLLTVDLNPDAGGGGGAWVTAIVGLIAFLVGGWVTGASSAVRGTGAGLLNGFLMWGLGTVLILALSTLGLGTLFGALGNTISRFLLLGRPNPNLAGVDPGQIAGIVRNASWWAFLSLALSAAAAAIGGWLGAESGPIGKLARMRRASS